ncbi:MAG: hypothetical protein AAF903_09190 [Pseudomonadota bacterium]
MSFDWLQSTAKQRKILYAYLKREMDRRNVTLSKMLEQSIKTSFGQDYRSNMRSGRYSQRYAFSFWQWLDANNPEQAQLALEEVLRAANSSPPRWDDLVSKPAKQIEIIPIKAQRLNIVGFASGAPVYEIEKGRLFYLRIETVKEGWISGFQKMDGVWYPLPLSPTQLCVQATGGIIELPRSIDGVGIEPIFEEEETGRLDFHLFQHKEQLSDIAIEVGKALPTATLDNIAEQLSNADLMESYGTRLLIV